jgi:hypothetical protein
LGVKRIYLAGLLPSELHHIVISGVGHRIALRIRRQHGVGHGTCAAVAAGENGLACHLRTIGIGHHHLEWVKLGACQHAITLAVRCFRPEPSETMFDSTV